MVDIWWHGQACFKIKGKKTSCVIDPYESEFTGLNSLKLQADIVCITHDHQDHNNFKVVKSEAENTNPFVINGSGEYEISGINVVGISSYHDNQNGTERGKNTIYLITVDEINIVHLGDLGQKKLTQDQVEQLSVCDILLIPVGGVYTIEAKDAPDIISQIEPKIIVPMHYKIEGLKFNLSDVNQFLATMGREKTQPQPKLSISKEKLPEEVEIVVLEANG
ncbi:hypothetical protein A3F02_02900 [Candidatus Curtissbacteria bacterium RIFCSPHIGHO2_12_FULL_38_9b]|uniref:Lactamase n=2 Tax=Candidatus Curtissiibacteriota TaxID=1752717 RepID=A0A1F5GYW0_9BACT|nr:MAG: hypothetical protein A3A48_02655 [Candidatus Curtissbacteria bacterium RIFCSPLOWO2_01_FULL_37_9]OGD96984.1 MAG: hypothetical protein A3F02_02900 [Candidatus Curtissbacteria bacterium RIFCSPHIGHO2_12_FULL_38_9b]